MDESEQHTKSSAPISKALEGHFSFSYDGFSKPVSWVDGVGLSRVHKYSNGHASLYKIGIGNDELKKESPKKSLWISVSYGKETMGGISFVSEKQSLYDPVEVDFRDEFFYDVQTKKFFQGDKEITPVELFKFVEGKHMLPTKLVRGFAVRVRLWFWRKLLPGIIKWIDIALVALLFVVSGERIKGDIWKRLIGIHFEKTRERIPERELEFEESKRMDFFGYKAKRWSVVFYCTLNLAVFVSFFFMKVEFPWSTYIFENNFLALCYVVVSFAITEALIPQLLKSAISKTTPKVFASVAFKRLKI